MHNIRIERLWCDVRRSVVDKYKNLFTRMEEETFLIQITLLTYTAYTKCLFHVLMRIWQNSCLVGTIIHFLLTGDPPMSKLIIDRKYFLTVIETCGLAGIFV